MSTFGYPGVFPGGLTTGFKIIGGAQKTITGAAGYPGTYPAGLTSSGMDIGAAQKQASAPATGVVRLLFF